MPFYGLTEELDTRAPLLLLASPSVVEISARLLLFLSDTTGLCGMTNDTAASKPFIFSKTVPVSVISLRTNAITAFRGAMSQCILSNKCVTQVWAFCSWYRTCCAHSCIAKTNFDAVPQNDQVYIDLAPSTVGCGRYLPLFLTLPTIRLGRHIDSGHLEEHRVYILTSGRDLLMLGRLFLLTPS